MADTITVTLTRTQALALLAVVQQHSRREILTAVMNGEQTDTLASAAKWLADPVEKALEAKTV
jgi:hypothetical protein